MAHYRAGALFRFDLELFGQAQADPLGVEQRPDFDLVFQSRAGRVAEAVARALVALLEDALEAAVVVVGYAQLHADLFVQILGDGLG